MMNVFPRFHGFVWAVAAISIVFLPDASRSPFAQAICQEQDLLPAALRANDAVRASDIAARASRNGACSAAIRRWIGDSVALLFAAEAERAGRSGRPMTERIGHLEKALQYGRPWQALAMLADVRFDQREYKQAAELYGEALNKIEDDKDQPPPPRQALSHLVERARGSWLAASANGFVAPSSTRDGRVGGAMLDTVRGFSVQELTSSNEGTSIPIRFEFGRADLTEDGRRAARLLFEHLAQKNPTAIQLVGHTDPVGSREYNFDLSKRRAEAVALFLRESGYRGAITTTGRGFEQPLRLDSSEYPDENLRNAMLRRVELK